CRPNQKRILVIAITSPTQTSVLTISSSNGSHARRIRRNDHPNSAPPRWGFSLAAAQRPASRERKKPRRRCAPPRRRTTTGRDLPRPGRGPDHDPDDPSRGRDTEIGRSKNDWSLGPKKRVFVIAITARVQRRRSRFICSWDAIATGFDGFNLDQ